MVDTATLSQINHLADVRRNRLFDPCHMKTVTSTAVMHRNPMTGGLSVNLTGITVMVDGSSRAEPWNQTLLWVAQELRQLVQRETGFIGAQVTPGATELTAAERAVVDLVAQGLTNKQVAGRLHVSHRTVDSHVSHALAKLGLRSRVQLARLVALDGGQTLQPTPGVALSVSR